MALLRLGQLQQFLSAGSRKSQKSAVFRNAASRHWVELNSRCLKGSTHLPAHMEEE